MIAAIVTTTSWIPQAIRTIRAGEASDFSWAYLIAFMSGIATWLFYGVLKSDIAIILANAITLTLLVPIAFVKMRSEKK